MESILPGQLRSWYGRMPRARRVYGRLRHDATAIAGGITFAAREVRFIVGCIVDPPTKWPRRRR